MPITTFQNILSTDRLQSGFRAKFNANVALLITDITDNGDGTATVELQGGTNFQVDLGDSFYTKDEVISLITSVEAAVWGAITGDVTQQTDVVGNLGEIDNIDALLFSVNFAVASGDSDNPFGAFPASGYASFSVPGSAGTGWQLLIKEADTPEIKFRVYDGIAWQSWVSIGSVGKVLQTINSGQPATYNVTADDLLIINAMDKYPAFVALISGTPFPDIQPTYTGSPGSFSAITVGLHNNGAGNNADTTTVQFS